MKTRITVNNIYHQPLPEYDRRNPPRTVPGRFSYDPIHPDAEEIIEKLKNAGTEGEVRVLIWKYFGKYFGEEIMGNDWDSYKDSILDLWKWYGR